MNRRREHVRLKLGDVLLVAIFIGVILASIVIAFGCAPLGTYEQRGADTTRAQTELMGKVVQPQAQPITVGNIGSGATVTINAPQPQAYGTFDGTTGARASQQTEWSATNKPALWLGVLAAALLVIALILFFKLTSFGKNADALVGKSLLWVQGKLEAETDVAKKETLKELEAELQLLKTKIKTPTR